MPKAALSAAVSPDQRTFYLKKGRIRPLLIAIIALQQRDDISGKFAKKLARMRRAIARADEETVAERQDILEAHAKRDDTGAFLPVFAEAPDGKPVFKKDDKGNDTDERIVLADQFQLKDRKAYEAAIKELVAETIAVDCLAFVTVGEVPELERFKSVRGEIIDALIDLEEDAETTVPPLAIEARGAAIGSIEIARPELAADEDRSAP